MKTIIVITLILIDFFSKKIIFNYIELNQIIFINPFLDFTHIHNYGISFGLFAGTLPAWLIALLGIIITIFLYFWMIKTDNEIEKIGILLIISGAISNIGDRILNNYVLDFIFLHYNNFYWPAFNFADIYISIGIILVIIESYRMFKKKNK
tara:strand:- start:2103 stop:2555 length:453 start_codon:yes stop_codon:yes gene_type:complete